MRALNRSNERLWEKIRYMVFEDILGNPNIKKSSKPRRPSDLFGLSIDVKIKVEPLRISQEQADGLKENRGWNIPKCFIKQEDE